MLHPDEMATFLEVVRAGSLLRAAERLHVSQSTVSYRLGALERRVGHSLVNRVRGGSGVTLTPTGRQLFPLAENWEQLTAEVERLQNPQRFRIAVGAAHSVARHLLRPLYQRLATQRESLAVSLHTGTGPQLEELLATGRLDAAFTLFPPQHSGIVARRVVSSPLLVVINAPFARSRTDDSQDAVPWIDTATLDADDEVRLYWGDALDDWRRSAGLTTARLWCDSVLMLHPLLSVAGTWSLLPEFVASDLARETGSALLAPRPEPPPQQVYLLRRRGRSSSSAEVALLDHLVSELWPSADRTTEGRNVNKG